MTGIFHVVVDPQGRTPRKVVLATGDNHVGRASENEIAVTDVSLSRRHARLRVAGNTVVLKDLDSRNGTFVGESPVQERELRAGDAFRCGDVGFALGVESVETRPVRQQPGLGDLLASAPAPRSAGAHHSSLLLRASTGTEERARQKLEVLLRVSQVLSSPSSLDQMLSRVLDLLFQVFDADRASLLLLDAQGRIEPRLTRSRGRDSQEAIHSQNIVETALKQAVGVLAGDASQDPRFAGAASVQLHSIRSSMCVPLRVRETDLGALYVDHLSVPDRYHDEDLDFLASFASQAAVALDNIRLYAELEAEAVRRGALSRFFPPSVLGPVLNSRDFGVVPQDLDVTVVFSDISGFTAMSSTMAPRDVVGILNRYFPVMAEIVFRHEGTLEKYIGDALMAIWGAPVPHEDDADRALRAALEMRAAVARLNAELPTPLEIHVGLNSGPVAFGNIGSADYQQFAAIGDATNVASRVCSLAGLGEVLVSEAVRQRLRDRYDLEALPPARVKGKDEPLQAYRVR